jgi:O-antigen ligase
MTTILITLYSLLITIIFWRNLKTGIFWLILTLPAYLIRFEIFNLPSTLLELNILILFAVFFIKHVKQIKLIEIFKTHNLFLVSCFLFLVASIISIFISPNFISALGLWRAYFLEPILFLIVFVSVIKKSDFEIIFKILSWQILILSLFAIYQKFTGAFISNPFWAEEATRRVTSIFPYPNALALYLAPIIILLIGYLIKRFTIQDLRFTNIKKLKFEFWNFLYLVSCILSLVAIYFTKSKGALIAILAGIIFYAFFYKGYRKIFTGILIIVILLSCYLIVSGKLNIFGDKTVEGGDSVSTRLEMWNETWQMLKTKPIFGAGLAGYQTAVAPFHVKDYIEIYLYPHNIILNFWTEIGLIGLLAFLGIIFWFFKQGFVLCHPELGSGSRGKQINIILMSSMIVLLIHGLVDVPYFKNDLAILFWLIIGMMIIINNEKYEKNL